MYKYIIDYFLYDVTCTIKNTIHEQCWKKIRDENIELIQTDIRQDAYKHLNNSFIYKHVNNYGLKIESDLKKMFGYNNNE